MAQSRTFCTWMVCGRTFCTWMIGMDGRRGWPACEPLCAGVAPPGLGEADALCWTFDMIPA